MAFRTQLAAGAALLLSTLRSSDAAHAGYPPFSAIGTPNDYEDDESKRAEWFRKLHGEWPPPKVYPGGNPRKETAKWMSRMDEYETWLGTIEDIKTRWELWLDYAQMRMLANFTPSGWAVTEIDPQVHLEVSTLYKQRATVQEEGEGSKLNQSAFVLVGDRDLWDLNQNLPQTLYHRLIQAIQDKLAQWVDLRSEQLTSTAAYGVRIYKRGSVLRSHVDHLETHVLSAVYCIDIEGEDEGAEPWYLGAFPDFLGEDAKVNLRPGQLFLYESAKLPHARPGVFHGERYAAMFVHFKPDHWNLTRFDRIYVPPPAWDRSQSAEL